MRPVFTALLDHVEHGWCTLQPIHAWFTGHLEHAAEHSSYADLLNFADGDVWDLFLMSADMVADLVPGWPGWEAEADPIDVEGYFGTFRRYLSVLRFASERADVPFAFGLLVRQATRAFEQEGWDQHLSSLLAAADEWFPR